MNEHQVPKMISEEEWTIVLDKIDRLHEAEERRLKHLRNRIARWLRILAGKIEIRQELTPDNRAVDNG